MYGGWFMPCHINVFLGRKRERSPRENPPKGDFIGFSHGDLSPRQAKIRQTVAKNATRGMWRTFVWRGERSPCENTKKSPFGRLCGDLSRFRPCLSYLCLAGWIKGCHAKTCQIVILACFSRGDFLPRQAKIRQTGGEKATHEKCCTFVWRGERSPCEITKKSPFGGFLHGAFSPFCPENMIIRHGTN